MSWGSVLEGCLEARTEINQTVQMCLHKLFCERVSISCKLDVQTQCANTALFPIGIYNLQFDKKEGGNREDGRKFINR